MAGLTTIVFCGIFLFWLLRYLSWYYRTSGLPGPKRYPFVGSALELMTGRIHEQCLGFAQRYGPITEIKLFNTTTVLLNNAEIANKALCADGYKHVFNDRPNLYIANYIYHGHGITFQTSPDKVYTELRKALAKGLHFYGDGVPKFETLVGEELHRIMDEVKMSPGREIEVVSLTNRSLCNMISLLMIGERATETDVKNIMGIIEGQDYFMELMVNTTLLNLPFLIYLPCFKKRYDKVMLERRNILEKYFYKAKESRKPGEIRGLVDWYLQEQEKEELKTLVSDDAIMATIVEIISAGLITTVVTLPSAILCLARHPEYQKKVQEELDLVVGRDREPSFSDKERCPFLEAVIMETLRYKPGGPFALPRVCKEDTSFEGYTVKAGTELLINMWAIHHDEKLWGDPWVFRPGRFLDEDGHLLPPNHVYMKSWQVFGVGRRKCPGVTFGMSRLFLYLSHLFQKWTILPSPGKCGSCDPRSEDYDCELQVKPKPFYCVVQPRN